MNHFLIGSVAAASALLALDRATQEPAPAQGEVVPVTEVTPAAPRAIELAICLDTSGSMDGLIEAAKRKLWAIVNDLALVEGTPRLRVALYSYGNNGHLPENGWVRQLAPLTEDLDLVSQRLLALTTNGGTELVGRVVQAATTRLDWSPAPGALKLIVVAGNESADQDQVVRFRDACKAAIERDVMVDAIYCGNPADDIAPGWREAARLADGQFAAIDHDNGTVVVTTPFDARLAALSAGINDTYVPYGADGRRGWENQRQQDANASGCDAEAAAQRAISKGGKLYCNRSWDLVDACRDGTVELEELKEEELPEVMRAMTLEERRKYVDGKWAERCKIQAQVAEQAAKRQAFIDEELKKQGLDETKAFDFVLRKAIRGQAAAKGLRFLPPPQEPEPGARVEPGPKPTPALKPTPRPQEVGGVH